MTHTYRDSAILESSTLKLAVFPLIVFGVIAALGLSGLAHGFTRAEQVEGVVGLVLVFALGYFKYREHRYGTCAEIRLCDDGMCELETKRRVIRLHPNQIRSVAYSRSDEGASYTVEYHDGHLRVTDGMAGFHDFLARLKKLNPAVDLTSFPPDLRPGLGIPQEAATSVGHGIRHLLFPLAVVGAMVWLAIETLTTR